MELVSNDLVTLDDDVEAEEVFSIDVSGYEGPLHLLLDLARKQKVDLLHVSILELATQYLGFIQEAQDKRIDLAADYLLMAAWLAFLKSRLLLPKPKKDSEEEASAEDDARKLAFRLKRLDAMREAGAKTARDSRRTCAGCGQPAKLEQIATRQRGVGGWCDGWVSLDHGYPLRCACGGQMTSAFIMRMTCL